MADLIPKEIFFNHIFLKLPVKSLMRCKCVCKAWNRGVRDPEFVRMHFLLNQHRPNQKLLISTSTIPTESHRHFYSLDYEASHGTTGGASGAVKLNLNFPALVHYTEVLGSSNGLLCVVVRYQKRKWYATNDEDVLIWNPSTGDCKLIPDTNPSLYISTSSLVGFGYESSINDGKIVRLTNFNLNIPGCQITTRVDIYSIKTNSWKMNECESPFSLVGVRACERGCALNGSIYWLVDFYRGAGEGKNYAQMVAFDIKENKFRKLQLPRDIEPFRLKNLKVYLEVLGGTLTLTIYRFSLVDELGVWTMKKGEKEEWTKLRNVNVSSLNYGVTRFIRLVCLMRNGKILVLCHKPLKRSDDVLEKMLVLYDLKRNEKEDFSICGVGRRYTFGNVVTYVESLVSPDSIAQGP